MKVLYFTSFFLLSVLIAHAQNLWADKAVCNGNAIEIGDESDINLCYSWKSSPADPNITNLKDRKINVNPLQTTTYTRTAIGSDFSSVKIDQVRVILVSDVVFNEVSTQKYGYDNFTNASIPWKSLQKSSSDDVNVKTTPAGGFEGVFFKSTDINKVTLTSNKATSDQSNLKLTGVNNGDSEIQANCEKDDGNNIKKINTKTYTLKTKTVAIRLVNATNYSSTDVSDAAIKSFLNDKCYNQAVFKWTIVRLPAKTVDFDINKDGKFDDNTWMSPEMQIVRDNCKDDTYDHNIFLIDKPTYGGTGYMQFNQRYGFVYGDNSQNPPSTIAHELGHGGFGLVHTPSDLENIMYDFNSTTKFRLRKDQWDLINP